MASTAPAPAPPAQDSLTTVIPAATSNPAQGSPTSFTAPLVSAHVWSRRTGLHTSSSVIMPLSQLLMQTYKPAFEVVRAKVRNPNNSKWGNAIFDYNHISTTLLGRTWTATAEGGLTAPPPPAPAITIPQAALLLEQHDLSIEVYSVANACIFTYPNPKPSHAVAKPAAFLVTLRTPIDQTDLQLPLPHEKLPELKTPAATCHSTASTTRATKLRSPPSAQGSFAPHATCISHPTRNRAMPAQPFQNHFYTPVRHDNCETEVILLCPPPLPTDRFTYNPSTNPVMRTKYAQYLSTVTPLSKFPWAYYIRLFASRHLLQSKIDYAAVKAGTYITHIKLMAAYKLFTQHHKIPFSSLDTGLYPDDASSALCSQLDTMMGWRKTSIDATKPVSKWYGAKLHLMSSAEMALTPPLPPLPPV